ncbi:MAG: class I SAM-dependent methyltransferase [Planctomycetaceae bacterium]|jgi:2-polyprenyl-3-methyl-5-hydroxy-6-metoxy-1,4-benzoquinol methylase|nr:class I SAM-dependent methyltransferase [Planctomycetaceae bacterium]
MEDGSVSTDVPNQTEYERFELGKCYALKYCQKNDVIMDIGCASGAFLQILKENGFTNLYGMDLSIQNLENLRMKGMNTIHGSITTLKLANVNAKMIAMFHVLEHCYELNDVLSNVKSLLIPGGLILIEVPNVAKYNEIEHSHRYPYLLTHEHINHFSKTTIINLCQKQGFQVIESKEQIVTIVEKWPAITLLLQLTDNLNDTITVDQFAVEKFKDYISLLHLSQQNSFELKNKLISNWVCSQTPIAIWGAGEALTDILVKTELKKCNIVHIVDNDIHKQGKEIIKYTVCSPDILKNYQGTIVVVANFYLKNILDDIVSRELKNTVYTISDLDV